MEHLADKDLLVKTKNRAKRVLTLVQVDIIAAQTDSLAFVDYVMEVAFSLFTSKV